MLELSSMPIFPSQHLKRLVDLARKGRVAPLYLFVGDPEEAYAKASKIVSVLVEKGALYESFDLQEASFEDLMALLSEAALFGPLMVVLVKHGEQLAGKKDIVSRILKSLAPGSRSLCLLAETYPEEDELYRYALEKGVVVPLNLQKGQARFLSDLPHLLSEAGKKMDREVAEYFLSLLGEDYARFRNELEKLILYTGDREIITRDDVEAVVSPDEEAALFLLGDVLIEKGPEVAWGILRRLLEGGEVPARVLKALTTFFKRLWLLHYLLSSKPELLRINRFDAFKSAYENLLKEVWPERPPAVLTKLHPYAVFRLKRHLREFSSETFPKLFYYLWELDLALKKDFRDPYRAFYEFFIRVFELQRRGMFQKSPQVLESFG